MPAMTRQSKGRASSTCWNLANRDRSPRSSPSQRVRRATPESSSWPPRTGIVKKTPLSRTATRATTASSPSGSSRPTTLIGVALTTRQRRDRPGHARRHGDPLRGDRRPRDGPRRRAACAASSCARATRSSTWSSPTRRPSLLTVCENGYGKRTGVEEYRSQTRGGMGVINIKTTDRNGKVVALKTVRDERRADAHHRQRHDRPHRPRRDPRRSAGTRRACG